MRNSYNTWSENLKEREKQLVDPGADGKKIFSRVEGCELYFSL
jgi:hypothetical protein